MTSREVQRRFDLEVAKYGVIDPVFGATVEDYINYAYQAYIDEMYDSLINPAIKFEINERVSRILAPLLRDYTETTFVAITTNNASGYYIEWDDSNDLQYIITEKAVFTHEDCNEEETTYTGKILPIKHNMIRSNINNPFLNPTLKEEEPVVWRMNIFSDRLELIFPSRSTPISYTCRYIKKQTPYTINPADPANTAMEIDSSVHGDIAQKAAIMYLSDLRINTQKTETNGNT